MKIEEYLSSKKISKTTSLKKSTVEDEGLYFKKKLQEKKMNFDRLAGSPALPIEKRARNVGSPATINSSSLGLQYIKMYLHLVAYLSTL